MNAPVEEGERVIEDWDIADAYEQQLADSLDAVAGFDPSVDFVEPANDKPC